MSIKPSVVYIKGVHSITGHDQSSDIGFPQLELEKLFEGATLKQIDSGTNYDSNKKYIYKNEAGNVAIQDEGHFNCIKNGYYSIANGINHYYTKSGDNYSYNAVPSNVNTWAGKWTLSNAIKNKDLYSISPETDRICVGDTYYKKNGNNNYVKQTTKTYTLYETVDISWQDQDKYICNVEEDDETLDEVIKWKNNNGNLAKAGYYISVFKQDGLDTNGEPELRYIIQLLYIDFNNEGIWESNSGYNGFALYKFNYANIDNLYVRNENHLIDPTNKITFYNDPTANIRYFYHKIDTWLYPNILSPSHTPDLMTDSNNTLLSYSTTDYPLYSEATVTVIDKISNPTYTIYEKTAVKINYNYSGDANSLKFIFTDKDIDGVLTACNLPNDIKQYVHLTNLEYNK